MGCVVEYKFDRPDWFSSAQPLFDQMLSPYRAVPSKFLEIGSYEGRSAAWFLDNILTHPKSHLTCVDPCHYGYAANLRSNLSPHVALGKCRLIPSFSEVAIPKLLSEKAAGTYDFSYVDGCHHSEYVLRDAVFSFLLTKVGGLIAFDDYKWTHGGKRPGVWGPKPAIDSFLSVHEGSLEILVKDWQVWVRKIRDFPDTEIKEYCID